MQGSNQKATEVVSLVKYGGKFSPFNVELTHYEIYGQGFCYSISNNNGSNVLLLNFNYTMTSLPTAD